MKKIFIAAMMLFCVGGTVLAQNAPKQQPPKQEKKEVKKTHLAKHHSKKMGHKDSKKTTS